MQRYTQTFPVIHFFFAFKLVTKPNKKGKETILKRKKKSIRIMNNNNKQQQQNSMQFSIFHRI